MDFDHTTGLIQSNVTDGTVIIGGVVGLQLPVGTTAQRASTPNAGAMRLNTTTGRLELYNNSAWGNIGLGDVTSVALSLPSIFSVTGSPITTSGTLTATLISQASNTVFAAPNGSAGTPSFRLLSLNNLSDVATTAPATNNLLVYNGSLWTPTAFAASSASGVLSTWTSIGGTPVRYTATFTHNLGTSNVVVSVFDTATNKMVIPDGIQLTDTNNVLITLASNTRTLRVVVVANGVTVAGGGGGTSLSVTDESVSIGTATTLNFTGAGITATAGGSGVVNVTVPASVANAGGAPSLQQDTTANRPTFGTAGRLFLATDTNILYRDTGTAWVTLTDGVIKSYVYGAASLDNPNSSDWVINALAPSISDPTYASLSVRSFDQTTEQGVGLLVTPPTAATSVIFTFKGRPQVAQAASQVVQHRVYRRSFPNGSAPGAWGAAVELTNITVPATANFVYSSQTVSLATLGWTAGQMTLVEITRRTSGVTGGTNLATPWLLAELTLEFI